MDGRPDKTRYNMVVPNKCTIIHIIPEDAEPVKAKHRFYRQHAYFLQPKTDIPSNHIRSVRYPFSYPEGFAASIFSRSFLAAADTSGCPRIAETTATPFAPASTGRWTFSALMPPIAVTAI